jgi:small subunit ribosomal protein S9
MISTVGRRKRAVARLHLQEGTGKFFINKREKERFLNNDLLVLKVERPFRVTELSSDQFDIHVNVTGGGINGQAEAITLAISRALEKVNAELRPPLKKEKLLRVDSRKVERKKYGKPKARKSFQFSKR